MHFAKNQLKRCKYGWMLFHGPYIGKCFELYGQYSESEVRIIRTFVTPGSVAIDVGANIGDLTVPMALCAGPGGRIFAVESHLDNYYLLCANLALNEIRNTKAINAFVADSDQVDTDGAWGKYGFVSETWQPPYISIDSMGLDSCSFIKIDVDGKELEILRSAEATLAKHRPVIYYENDLREKSGLLFDHLAAREYQIYWHPAPIFETPNFFGNSVNHWAPQNINSLMMLAIPQEKSAAVQVPLPKMTHADQWWDQVQG